MKKQNQNNSLKIEFGLEPDIPNPEIYWGCRALVDAATGLTILWKNQTFIGKKLPHEIKVDFINEINNHIIPDLCNRVKSRYWWFKTLSVCGTFSCNKINVAYDTKNSNGYLYIGIWKERSIIL